jgi:CelD/BcsL family acetyltransferase involved in cellulose biosynthesis
MNDVRASELTTLGELRALYDEWLDLWRRCASATPFQHPAWLCEWVEQFRPEAPRVLVLRRHQRLVGLVPLLIYREGARRVVGLLGGGVSDYLDALFDDSFHEGAPQLLACLDELFRLHGARWQARAQPGMVADPAIERFHRRVAPALLDAGIARLQVLRWGGRGIAACYAFVVGQTTYCHLSGFDPEHRRFSPGKLALLYAIERAIVDGCTVFDWLRGDEPYKQTWGVIERPIQRWHLLPLTAARSDRIEWER